MWSHLQLGGAVGELGAPQAGADERDGKVNQQSCAHRILRHAPPAANGSLPSQNLLGVPCHIIAHLGFTGFHLHCRCLEHQTTWNQGVLVCPSLVVTTEGESKGSYGCLYSGGALPEAPSHSAHNCSRALRRGGNQRARPLQAKIKWFGSNPCLCFLPLLGCMTESTTGGPLPIARNESYEKGSEI